MGGTEGEDYLDLVIKEYWETLRRKGALRREFSEVTKIEEKLENELKKLCPHSRCKSLVKHGSCAYDRTVTSYTCERCKLVLWDKPKDTIIIETIVL
jgi:hypothetical protein